MKTYSFTTNLQHIVLPKMETYSITKKWKPIVLPKNGSHYMVSSMELVFAGSAKSKIER